MRHSTPLRMALLCILVACGLSAAYAQPRGQAEQHAVYLPLLMNSAKSTPPPAPSPTPPGSLPAALVGTWFSGQLLPRALYDPTTGAWGSANGLGQMYEFTANGTYTYLASFRVENPGCASEVSVYRQGTARASGGSLTLKPMTAKTRTVVNCGGRTETVTDGPYDARVIPWSAGHSQFGVKQLTITEDGATRSYYKDGMAEELLGTWKKGAISSANFYNTTTKVFAEEPGEGWWISIAADGRYSWGEFGYATDQAGCALAGWLYIEGTASVSGGHITFTPTAGVARVENACNPEQPRQEPWKDDSKGFTWLFHDFATSPKLVLMPDGRFEEHIFLPE